MLEVEMKLFMRSLHDKNSNLQEIKDPMKYATLCIVCAGKLGGKADRQHQCTWYYEACDCCKEVKEVTQPRDFIWRA
jgi:hypothetical protein